MFATMAMRQAAEAAGTSPAARLLNDRPKPRVLLLGDVDQDVVAEVTRLGGHVEHRNGALVARAAGIRWEDWDAVILGPTEPRPKPPTVPIGVGAQLVADTLWPQTPPTKPTPSAGPSIVNVDGGAGLDIPAAIPVVIISGDRAGGGALYIDRAVGHQGGRGGAGRARARDRIERVVARRAGVPGA